MRQKLLLTGALALSGMLASCDDGRYLVGILGQGPSTNMPGAGGAIGNDGGGGAAGSGNGMMVPGVPPLEPPLPNLCARGTSPQPARPLRISTDQVAERLSRFLFLARPEPDFLMLTSTLRNSADVEELTRMLVNDGRANVGVIALMNRWLGHDAIGTAVGAASVKDQFTPELRNSMRTESSYFVSHLMRNGDHRLRTLLTANYTFVDRRLASHYGLPVPPDDWVQVMLDPNQRSGLLTHASVLTANPRASFRGSWLHQRLLCQGIPAPPQNVEQPDLDVPVPMKSTRQRLDESVASPVCKGCHMKMDEPGYAFEHFDPLGRWRDRDNGVPIDASGSLTSLPEGGGYMFNGAPQLGAALAGDCSVQVCAAQVFLQQAVGGTLRSSDGQSLGPIWSAFARSDFDLHELIVAVTGSEAFLSP